jgi:phospholipid N-methyltransferase
MSLGERLHFLRSYLRDPLTVGAIGPSSRRLGEALIRPFARRRRASRVLEIGAGTGAVTRRVIALLREGDHFDVCEIDERLADVIEAVVLSEPSLAPARTAGRVRLLRCAAEQVDTPEGYDFVISGLPFTTFEPAVVDAVLASVRRNLRPGGVFSYFEYIGLRRLNQTLAIGRVRRRVHAVSTVLDGHIDRHQFNRETVLWNLPPAIARHWRFDGAGTEL